VGRSRITSNAVQCDEKGCGWMQNIPWGEVKNWHKKACPKCGHGEIISDVDLATWHGINAMLLLDNAIDPDGKSPRVSMRLDTSGLRAE